MSGSALDMRGPSSLDRIHAIPGVAIWRRMALIVQNMMDVDASTHQL